MDVAPTPAAPAPAPEAPPRASPRTLANRVFTGLDQCTRSLCAALYRRQPAAALMLAGAAGCVVARVSRPVSAATLAGLLGEPLAAGHHALARRLCRNNYKDTIVSHLLRTQGPAPLTRTLRCNGLDRLVALQRARSPAIVAFTHLGPPYALLLALGQAELPLLVVSTGPVPFPVPAGARVQILREDAELAALSLKAALGQLHAGGLVMLAADGGPGVITDGVRFAAASLRLARGIAVLHRLTGAAVIPATVRWGQPGWRIVVEVLAPLAAAAPQLPGPDREEAIQAQLSAWLEAEVRAHPDELRPAQIARHLLAPAKADQREGQA